MTKFLRQIPSAQLGTKVTGKQKGGEGHPRHLPHTEQCAGQAGGCCPAPCSCSRHREMLLQALDPQPKPAANPLQLSRARLPDPPPLLPPLLPPRAPGPGPQGVRPASLPPGETRQPSRGESTRTRRPEGLFNLPVLYQT